MEKFFTKANVYKIIKFIFETCKSEAERINKESVFHRSDARSIVSNTIKSSEFIKESGIELMYTMNTKYDLFGFEGWLEELIKRLVKTKESIKSAKDEFVLAESEGFRLVNREYELIFDFAKMPKEYSEFIKVKRKEVLFNKNYNWQSIVHEATNIPMTGLNFCLLFYLMYQQEENIKKYCKPLRELFENHIASKKLYLTHQEIKDINNYTMDINKTLIRELVNNINLYSGSEAANKYVLKEMHKEYVRILDRYIIPKRPPNVKFSVDDDLNLLFFWCPESVNIPFEKLELNR